MKEIYLRSLIDKNITEDVVKNRYKQLKAELEGKLEFKVKHILVKEEKDIKKVQNELKTNKFEDVAKKYSIDTTAQNGGSLGYIIEGQTVKEFEDELKKAELNKISEPFKTQFGWHILVKEEQKNVKIPEFNEVKDNLKNELVGNFIKNYGENNVKKANIVLY